MGFHTFPKNICPKVNVIARLVFELAFYESAVQRFNRYTTRTSPLFPEYKKQQLKGEIKKNYFNRFNIAMFSQGRVNKVYQQKIYSWQTRHQADCILN